MAIDRGGAIVSLPLHRDIARVRMMATPPLSTIASTVEEGRVAQARIEQALGRLEALARRFAHGPEDLLGTLGSAEHRRLAAGLDAGTFVGRDPTER